MSSGKYRQQDVRAPRGTTLTAKSWLTEAPLRMLMNNLDPEVRSCFTAAHKMQAGNDMFKVVLHRKR